MSSSIFYFMSWYSSIDPFYPPFPFILQIFPFSLSSRCLIFHPSIFYIHPFPSSLPLSFLSCLLPHLFLYFLLCLRSICAALSKICLERTRGRIERRNMWKMDCVWALHYNEELSQGRFALPFNDASVRIYSPNQTCRWGLWALISLTCNPSLWYACVLLNVCIRNLFFSWGL